MKKNFLKLGLFALAFGFMFNATAQCPNDNFPYLNWNLSQEGQSVSTGCLFGGEYNSLNVIEGASYEISTCESSWDTQVTIYNASTGAVVGYNDDACGLQSIVNFTASFTGTVNILLGASDHGPVGGIRRFEYCIGYRHEGYKIIDVAGDGNSLGCGRLASLAIGELR